MWMLVERPVSCSVEAPVDNKETGQKPTFELPSWPVSLQRAMLE